VLYSTVFYTSIPDFYALTSQKLCMRKWDLENHFYTIAVSCSSFMLKIFVVYILIFLGEGEGNTGSYFFPHWLGGGGGEVSAVSGV
jgi:hypothetical protein